MIVEIFKQASWKTDMEGEHLATANVKKVANEAARISVNKQTLELREYLTKVHGNIIVKINKNK